MKVYVILNLGDTMLRIYRIAPNFRGLVILSTFRNLFFIHDCEVSSSVCHTENFVTKIFMMIIKFMKITKIFDHGNLAIWYDAKYDG